MKIEYADVMGTRETEKLINYFIPINLDIL